MTSASTPGNPGAPEPTSPAVLELLATLHGLGLVLVPDGENLRLRGALRDLQDLRSEIRAQIASLKVALLAHLKAERKSRRDQMRANLPPQNERKLRSIPFLVGSAPRSAPSSERKESASGASTDAPLPGPLPGPLCLSCGSPLVGPELQGCRCSLCSLAAADICAELAPVLALSPIARIKGAC